MSSRERRSGRRAARVAALAVAAALVGGDASADLAPEPILRVVASHGREVRRCYQLGLAKNPSLAGKVTVAWTIRVDGTVGAARVERTTLHDAGVEACLVDRLRTWRFPRLDHPANVSYPFLFTRG